MKAKMSNSLNHFLDTNVLLQHANNSSGEYSGDIQTILAESVGSSARRKLWVSGVIFAKLRPSSFVRGKFNSLEEFSRYIRSIATVVTPDPSMMLRAARLRDQKWLRPEIERSPKEKPRRLLLRKRGIAAD